MTTIPPLPAAARLSGSARHRSAGPASAADRFAVDDPPPAETATLTPTAELAGLQLGLLSLQHEPETVDERAHRGARRLLATLAILQRHLLDGGMGSGLLAELRGGLTALPVPLHPGLAAVMAAIVVRVEVELARHTPG